MKKVLGVVLVGLLTIGLTACGGGQQSSSDGQELSVKGAQTLPEEGVEVSKDHPLVIDKEARTVKVYATVNGKYTVEPTRHGLNFHEGKYGDEALFTSFANQTNFHDALVEIEAEPGNNLAGKSKDEFIEGDDLVVSVSWDGAEKDYDISEVVNVSTGNPINYKFGGNRDNANSYFTGCLACFDSCSVGVTSNSSEPVNAFDSKQADFVGNKDVLPEDGTPVIVTFALK
ncbi:hypothetical protein BEP19_14665 [Ammoniphilus oxalaticus]|uniref:4Fe-4S ferredoxin-type domain-containing protein n=1 Tax=Ammoniphilus oxalaticus TaxID=66863 RepID=A0A419SET9_9BACL|nr:YdjY domain-containing protein [Ammoniphilus oxalaticus]RKD21846.1 hypothetical protein BEP19_14665 [Ammoniphilus oxalaticus]